MTHPQSPEYQPDYAHKNIRNRFQYALHLKLAHCEEVFEVVSQVYDELRRINGRSIHDPIRERLFAVALYDLRLAIEQNDSLHFNSRTKNKIAQIILRSSSMDDSLAEVMKMTTLYSKFGDRMRQIASRNGGLGALIVMPSSLLTLRRCV